MGSFALELLLCVLAFGFGYAANQGGTCLVVAAHELHRRQPPKMFVGFLAASAAAGLVAVPIVWTGTLGATLAPSTSINFLLLIGAIAFGLGALINDTCLLGSLARLGDGEMRLLALPLGLTIGILAADHGRFGYDSTWPSLISKPSATGLVTLLAFLVVLVLALVFVSTKSVLRTKPGWSFGASMIGLGITGGLLYALAGLDLRRRDSTRPSSQNVPGRRGRAHCGDLFDRRRPNRLLSPRQSASPTADSQWHSAICRRRHIDGYRHRAHTRRE